MNMCQFRHGSVSAAKQYCLATKWLDWQDVLYPRGIIDKVAFFSAEESNHREEHELPWAIFIFSGFHKNGNPTGKNRDNLS